ncbi:AbrB family transcriptional regulator [Ammoniphilus sp. YIM 78166]|uniref:AbrB family transcriptional regulator n=1 Tax=Ammoniphilus sp. YIM 78166 TaxID=1644106 RepID=UPI00142FD39C|nr:AbrB family transcriptional regulator [Ammoniphilus sp. YIM 78166]
MRNQYLRMLETIGIAAVGGFVFSMISIPLPWLLGPIAFLCLWRVTTKREMFMPPIFFESSLLVLGYMLGAAFTKETAIEILHQLPFMAIVSLFSLGLSLVIGVMTARRLDLDLASVILGSVPGGLAQMIVISREIKGVDPTIVVFIQLTRVLSVIFLVPFIAVQGMGNVEFSHSAMATYGTLQEYGFYGLVCLAGFLVGRRIGLPNSILTGPLIATAVVMIIGGGAAPSLPPMIILLSQIVVGIHLGLQVKPEMLKSAGVLGAYSFAGSLCLILFSLLMAYGLTLITPVDLISGFLSTAPGGIAEMGITATVVKADLSTVSGYQLFRVLFILFVVAPFLQRWVTKNHPPTTDLSTKS